MQRTPAKRRRTTTLALTAGAAALAMLGLLTAPVEARTTGTGEPPGNKGSVKIHRTTTPDDDRRNQPKVCTFRIVGFGFPDDADIDLTIEGHGGPNAGTGTFEGNVDAGDLSEAGDFAIAGPVLPDGMYKLTADNTTAPGDAKHKVFKIECGEVQEASTTGGTTDDTTGGTTDDTTGGTTDDTTGGTTDDTTGGTTDDTGSSTGETGETGEVLPNSLERPASETGPNAQVLGETVEADTLPATGSELHGLAVLAAGLVVIGSVVLLARRRMALR